MTAVSWVFLGVALASSGAILHDLYVRGYRQRVGAMEAVWPISALYFGPLAVVIYYRWGRPQSERWQNEHGGGRAKSLPGATTTGGLPGAAAATLAHFVGVPLVVVSGLTIAGLDLWALILVIAVIAIALLFVFEYFFATVRERGLASGKGLGVALAIALVTVLAFDVGMGGWMILLHFSGLMPPPTEVAFVFLMQIGLILGFMTGYPAVAWLVGRGTKATV
ncbi:MAG: DUF4396 domain-containing protein [Solirubrobacterales bacterium]|nr:DUF4396 domain-containing protein [Solirubrobacterales bacterium]